MFLDDKLMEIWQDGKDANKDIVDICKEMMDECTSRIPNPAITSVQNRINDIKRIENGWRLFCKRNKMFRADAFKDVMMNRCGGRCYKYDPIYRALGWIKEG